MRNYLLFLFILSLLSLHTPEAHAQKWKKALHNVDSLVSLRYQRADIDTLYIIRPATKWTAKIRVNNSATQIKTLGVIDGSKSTSQMNADYKTTISAAISYMGISMGIALNPAKLLGKHKDFQFNLPFNPQFLYHQIINHHQQLLVVLNPKQNTKFGIC